MRKDLKQDYDPCSIRWVLYCNCAMLSCILWHVPFPTSCRLQEIIEWGLRNMRVPEKKGLFESVAEDWPFVPRGLRQWLRNVNGDFVAAHHK